MSEENKSGWKKYLICVCVGLGIVLFALFAKDFAMKTAKDWMHALHDGFFAAGMLMILFCGLLYVSSEGAFLFLGYAMGRAVRALIPFSRKDHETYQQYRERKMEKPRKKGDSVVFFVGLVFVAISLIFLFVWYQL